MSALDQIYSRGTILQIAGPEAEAFKGWRNRLGLFPETQKSEGWNKYSFVDIVTLSLVHDLTKRGIVAQVAVAVGMAARPLLADTMNAKIAAEAKGQTDALATAVLARMKQRKAFELHVSLPYMHDPDSPLADKPECVVTDSMAPVVIGSGQKAVIAYPLFEKVFFLFGCMHLMGTESELPDGTRRIEPNKLPGIAAKMNAKAMQAKPKKPTAAKRSVPPAKSKVGRSR